MARALLVADPLFAATTDNDVPEARPGQTSDDTLTASEPHRACGHGLDLLRPHAEKRMLKQETGTEMLPAQPRSDASHATEQAQEQAALQLRELGHAGQHTQQPASVSTPVLGLLVNSETRHREELQPNLLETLLDELLFICCLCSAALFPGPTSSSSSSSSATTRASVRTEASETRTIRAPDSQHVHVRRHHTVIVMS